MPRNHRCVRLLVFTTLIVSTAGLSGCKGDGPVSQDTKSDKQPQTSAAGAAMAPKAVKDTSIPEARINADIQAARSATKIAHVHLSEDQPPKLFIPLDAAGQPIPPKPEKKSELPRLLIGRDFAWNALGQGRILRVDLTGTPAPNGGIWKSVNGGGGAPSGSHGLGYNKDGTIDLDQSYTDDAGVTHFPGTDDSGPYNAYPPGSDMVFQRFNNDGTVDTQLSDGDFLHQNPDGSGYLDLGDQLRRIVFDKDGNTESIDPRTGEPPTDSNKGDGDEPTSHGPKGDKSAGGTGEPHYLTRDGTPITTQAAGEFVLTTGVPGHAIQVRQEPWGHPPNVSESASAITAMALEAGGAKIEVRESGEVFFNGTPSGSDSFQRADLPQGGAVGVWRTSGRLDTVIVVWPDLSIITIRNMHNYLNFNLQWSSMQPGQRGLLGSNDGNAENDLTDRSGQLQTSDAAGIAAFVESWRLRDEESLFNYAPGQSTATFTLRDFPKLKKDVDTSSVTGLDSLKPGIWRDFAAYDVALTEDSSFIEGYADMQRMAQLADSRAKLDQNPAILDNKPTAQDSESDTITLSSGEMENAKLAPADSDLALISTGDYDKDSAVYKFTFKVAGNHVVVSYMPCEKADHYTTGHCGYAFFGQDGKIIGEAVPASGKNGDRTFALPAGTVYFKALAGNPKSLMDLTIK